MDIDVPLRELGKVDISALQVAIAKLEQSDWQSNKLRQSEYEVHRQTESVVLVFTDGSGWPNIEVSKEAGWDLRSKACNSYDNVSNKMRASQHGLQIGHSLCRLSNEYMADMSGFEPWTTTSQRLRSNEASPRGSLLMRH